MANFFQKTYDRVVATAAQGMREEIEAYNPNKTDTEHAIGLMLNIR